MIIYKENKGFQTLSGVENENILTIAQRRQLLEAEQAEKELHYIENRFADIADMDSTTDTDREQSELKMRLGQAQGKIISATRKKELLDEITSLDSTVYVVLDNSELANKIMTAYPYYNFIEGEEGELIDIEVLPKPDPPAPQPTAEELQLEQNIDFDYRLSMMELGR